MKKLGFGLMRMLVFEKTNCFLLIPMMGKKDL